MEGVVELIWALFYLLMELPWWVSFLLVLLLVAGTLGTWFWLGMPAV